MSSYDTFRQFNDIPSSDVVEESKSKGCPRERILWILLVLALIGALIGVSVHFVTKKDSNSNDAHVAEGQYGCTQPSSTTVSATKEPPSLQQLYKRIDCIPESHGGVIQATKKLCEKRQCIFEETGVAGVPVCFFSDEVSYKATSSMETKDGMTYNLEQKVKDKGPFGEDMQMVVFDVEMKWDNIIRFKFDDSSFNRFKVPLQLNLPSEPAKNHKYEFRVISYDPFAFQIIRKSTGQVLFDTGVGGLVLSNHFLQISTILPSKNIYGFGENLHQSYRHDLNYTTWPMFSRDQPPKDMPFSNLYGVHPFYMCLENDGNSHGVFLLNSNAMDISFTPLPMLTYRTIGGILDFYIFLGPEPENVVQQYTGVIGKPYMPPYWALGFQLCRYGYKNLQDIQTAVNRTLKSGIPLEVQYADIDHMDRRLDFTLDKTNFGGLPDYFKELHNSGMRTVIILDPALANETNYEPYSRLTDLKGAIMWPKDCNPRDSDRDGSGAVLGYVWPDKKVVFPDFFSNKTGELWVELIVQHHHILPFDALWIDMNEPANFGTNEEKPWNWPANVTPWSLQCKANTYEDPPYRTKAAYVYDDPKTNKTARLSDKTLCMITRQGDSGQYMHYDVHNLYGWSETPATLKGIRQATGERSFVLSRSTYPGSGRYAGHWTGDNESVWPGLLHSIIGMLEFNLFGIPYVGADICGFWGNSTSEMCKRWMQLGAFYPFSRNHNQKDAMDQDPGSWGEDVALASREALETRYLLLPYLYTLFHKAHTDGNTVVRPLFHEFPKDNNTYGLDKQFMWGPGFMVIPILEQDQSVVIYYVPHGRWYDFYTGAMEQSAGNHTRTVNARSKIGLMVRGGHILPMQQPANTTKFSRKNPFELLVAMDEQGQAKGELFWDDGISVDTYETGNYFFARFIVDKNSITMTIENDNTPELPHLYINQIKVYGAPPSVQRVYHDGKDVHYTYQGTVLTFSNLTLTLTREFTIYWSTDIEDERLHIDCYPEEYGGVDLMTNESCQARNCIYNSSVSQGPLCYMNRVNYGYEVLGNRTDTENGFIYHLQKMTASHHSPYHSAGSPDIKQLNFIVEKWGPNVLRFRFEDVNTTRYHVPLEMKIETNKINNDNDMKYEVKVTSMKPFHFQVIRTTTQDVLWDTDLSSNRAISSDLTFSEQFLQITTKLPSKYIYGFGENVHHTFRHDLRHKKWPMWSRDQPTSWGDYLNHYGVHPFYMCLESVENGAHSHGVLLLNSNAQDYSFSPYPTLTYRTIGGILDFYMFLGPTPENVVAQYTGTVGRPYMPPYWSLGFQLCRYGYNNISNIQDAVDKTRIAEIPHDVQYVDIDHMDERMDFTIDHVNFPGLNQYFHSLQAAGMHIIIILDPTIISNVSGYEPYIKMRDNDSNIKWPSGSIPSPGSSNNKSDLLGYVWPKGKVVFPDFFKNSTKQVWKDLIVNHHLHNLTFDGLWIDMNEPANFGTNEERPFNWPEDERPYWSLNCSLVNSSIEHPPYRTMAAYAHDGNGRKAMISDKTICMRAVQGEHSQQYTHYNVHSLYGWSQTPATLEGLRQATGERGIVISRSTFPGSGKYAGHWLGDNNSGWKDLQRSIIGSLEFNLFGIPYIGADICGFFGNTTPELCKRWMQLGAFYTFSRNHNGLNNMRQDPGSLGPDLAKASKFAIETRYWLLPYLYTLFHQAHIKGHTVMRPLHHEFPLDTMTYDIDKQFLWGPALMISPILYEGQTSVNIYVPRGPWYDYYTGMEVTTESGYINVAVGPDSNIPLHVRSGYILPMQAPANNTHFSRKKPFTLLVALKDSMNGGRGFTADGELFWDDGISIDSYEKGDYYYSRFWSGSNVLRMTVEYNNGSTISDLIVDTILVYGVRTEVKYVYIGNTSHTNITYDVSTKVLKIMGLTLSLSQDFSLEWRQYRKPTEEEMQRVECAPDNSSDITPDTCTSRKCIYNATDISGLPKCYIDRSVFGYRRITNESNIQLTKINTNVTLFGNDTVKLNVTIIEHSNQVLQIKIFDALDERYEVPLKLTLPKENISEAQYRVVTTPTQNSEFSIQVIRHKTNKTIWDTSAGPLIFSDHYLQLSTRLPSDNLYGLGEHRHFHLKHSLDYKIWPIFTRDAAVNSPDFTNLYGAHPLYMNIEDEEGNAHAVLLLNSNAMEVVLEPSPRLTYRTLGGIFDFYIFMGLEPESVIQQYTRAIGKPVMVPYWALGFQLSRWGYDTLDNMKAAVNRTRAAGIPHDVQYADIDHMDKQRDFTYNNVTFAGLPEYIDELHKKHMHFIIILDPALSIDADYWPFVTGIANDVFIKWPKNTGPEDSHLPGTDVMLGYVWPENKTVFPDFFKNETKAWWNDTICRWHNTIKFDGLWIDMNEPSNFDTNGEKPWNWPLDRKPYWSLKCNYDNNLWDHPPYKPKSILGDMLSDKTLCMVAQQGSNREYKQYDVHSLYGMSQTEPTSVGLHSATGKRSIVISRSSYPSSGHTGGHWLGDNDSFWRNLHDSIIGIIEFNLFGIPYIGADICGFFANTTPELCQRWMQLGAFYTFSRNHNGKGMQEQDPGIFGAHITNSSRIAMGIRYSLLPYLYTLFFHAHRDGGTVIRSMMHEFPKDKRTWNLDTQFLWGSAFLIAPVLEEGKMNKDVYFTDARWFDYYTGTEIMARKTMVTVDAPRHFIPLFMRGGFIIPYQGIGFTTFESRTLPLGILVTPDDNQTAQGDLFWDDGDSIDTIENRDYFYATFRLFNRTVRMEIQTMNSSSDITGLFFESIWVYGVVSKPNNVTDMTKSLQFSYYDTKLLHIKNLNLTLNSNFTVTWS